MLYLLTFDESQGFSLREIEQFAILYWNFKDLNFHIFMAEA